MVLVWTWVIFLLTNYWDAWLGCMVGTWLPFKKLTAVFQAACTALHSTSSGGELHFLGPSPSSLFHLSCVCEVDWILNVNFSWGTSNVFGNYFFSSYLNSEGRGIRPARSSGFSCRSPRACTQAWRTRHFCGVQVLFTGSLAGSTASWPEPATRRMEVAG